MADVEFTAEQAERPDGESIQVIKTPTQPMTASDAARMLAGLRHKQTQPAEAPPEQPPAQESEAPAEEVAKPEEASPDQTQESEQAEEPAIEPPRSWSKEEKERFLEFPRETQEYLAERENQRDRAVNQAQKEAAETRKSIEAQRAEMEQARAKYEGFLPQVQQMLQESLMSDQFSDIKTIQDLERLARDDWSRYLQWDVAQKKVAAISQQMNEAQQRQVTERQTKFQEFAKKEDEAFTQAAPEAKDPKTFEKVQKGAVDLLKEVGFSDTELGEGWHGMRDFSLRDHRVQILIRDAYLYRAGQEDAKVSRQKMASQKKQPSPVQRPGTATGHNATLSAQMQALAEKLPTLTGNAAVEAAVQLQNYRRQQQ